MPKKPKEIQERVDKLIIENYTSKEIIEILKTDGYIVSDSYISSRRGKIKKPKKDENKNTHTMPELSNESIKSLFNLMGILGKKA